MLSRTLIRNGSILPLFLAMTPAALAGEGWYVSLEGGGSKVDSWDYVHGSAAAPGTPSVANRSTFDGGWAALGSVGFARQNWRLELEGSFRRNGLARHENGGLVVDADGHLTEYAAMFNVIHDVTLAQGLSLAVGLGAGGDHANLETAVADGPIDADAWRFAYQGVLGLNVDVTDRLSLFATYRYLNVSDGGFEAGGGLGVEGEELQKHTASLGVRFFLDQPAPPPQVEPQGPSLPPAPEPREFLVFFSFNSATLTPAALATVQQAATAATQLGTANIRIVGHADRAGSPAYNKALSMRRAQAVRTVMVQEGVSGSAITLRGAGESDPLVPTADGVREPQNRRVQITF